MIGRGQKGISIFLRILLALIVVNGATSSVLIFLAYDFSRESIERRTEENVAQQIEVIRDHFDITYRSNVNRFLRLLANSSALDDYLLASDVEKFVVRKKLETVFLQFKKHDNTITGASFADSDGTLVVDVKGNRRLRHNLNLKHESSDSAAEVPLSSMAASANLFRDLESIPLLLSSGNMEWFMPPREVAVQGPYLGEDGAVSFISGIAKIDLDTGSFGGVVMIRQSLDGFMKSLKDVRFFGTNPIWILGPDGSIIQQPDDEVATFDPRTFMGREYQGTLDLLSNDKGIVAYQDFSVVPGQPFIRVVVALPAALLLKDFFPATRFFSIVLACSLVVVLIVAWSVSRYLSKPIEQLATAAIRLADGDWLARVKVKATGEVQVLVDSFNQMAEQIRETSAARDQSVQSLTREVEVRKEAEEKLKDQAKEITSARIAAEAASQAKSEFLARMSHEIRTPMNGVIGMTELMLASEVTDRQRSHLDTVRRSGRTLLRVIDDILDFSKIEAGKLELESIDFDLTETVEDVAELLATRARTKGLELVCDLPCGLPTTLRGDPHRLRQMLMNLIGNAIKFTEDGEIVVRVRSEDLRPDRRLFRFSVSDTGIGISESALERVFDSFSQADGATTRRYGGTGLGLTITKELALAMGGEVGAESEEEVGSTFWFTAWFQTETNEEFQEEVRAPDLAGLRVLIVDDNLSAQQHLLRLVTAWGMNGDVANSSQSALDMALQAAASRRPYDILLLDHEMPHINGASVVKTLLQQPSTADLSIILLTALREEFGGDDAGVSDTAFWVTKPVRQSALLDQISHTLANSAEEQRGHLKEPQSEAVPSGARVLLADDNAVNQVVSQEMLEMLGCTTRVVENGLLALEAVSTGTYDLVLMDLQMPVMDGLEATRKIREWEEMVDAPRRLPIIALTADAMHGDRERCLAGGMDDYLSKPFTPSQLQAVLQRAQIATDPRQDPAEMESAVAERSRAAGGGETSDDEGLIDHSALDEIRALKRPGAPDPLARVIKVFLEMSPQKILSLRESVARGNDPNAVWRVAHNLKSSFANIGATKLSEMCQQLEEMGRQGETVGAAEVMAEIDRIYPLVCKVLASECEGEAA